MLVTAIIRFLFSSSFSHSNGRKCKQTAQTPAGRRCAARAGGWCEMSCFVRLKLICISVD